jgi:hypothetical protein
MTIQKFRIGLSFFSNRLLMTTLPNNYKTNRKSSSNDVNRVIDGVGLGDGSSYTNGGFLPQLSQARPAALTAEDVSDDVEESEDDMEWEEIDIMKDIAETSLPTRAVEVIIEDATKNQK